MSAVTGLMLLRTFMDTRWMLTRACAVVVGVMTVTAGSSHGGGWGILSVGTSVWVRIGTLRVMEPASRNSKATGTLNPAA